MDYNFKSLKSKCFLQCRCQKNLRDSNTFRLTKLCGCPKKRKDHQESKRTGNLLYTALHRLQLLNVPNAGWLTSMCSNTAHEIPPMVFESYSLPTNTPQDGLVFVGDNNKNTLKCLYWRHLAAILKALLYYRSREQCYATKITNYIAQVRTQ